MLFYVAIVLIIAGTGLVVHTLVRTDEDPGSTIAADVGAKRCYFAFHLRDNVSHDRRVFACELYTGGYRCVTDDGRGFTADVTLEVALVYTGAIRKPPCVTHPGAEGNVVLGG